MVDEQTLDEMQQYDLARARKRAAVRQQLENDAPRLVQRVPALCSLRLAITEHLVMKPLHHVKHVVVARAPALFKLPCHDPFCRDGGYDITPFVMRGLRAGEAEFRGNHSCEGRVGQHPCRRTMSFHASATYEEQPAAAE